MQRGMRFSSPNSSTKKVLMTVNGSDGLKPSELLQPPKAEHKQSQLLVKNKKRVMANIARISKMAPLGMEGGFYPLDSIIINYLSTEDCFHIIDSADNKSRFTSNYAQSITEKIIPLASALVKERRIKDIKKLLPLLKSTDTAKIPQDLINLDVLTLNKTYKDLCKEYESLWDFTINTYMKSPIQILNNKQKISLHSLLATYTTENEVAKLFYRAVFHKKFRLLKMLQEIIPYEKLLSKKNVDAKSHDDLSLLGNIVNQLSLSIDKFSIKTQLLSSLLYCFPKASLRTEINSLEKHAVKPQHAKFMLLYAFEKMNGPPWSYTAAERGLAFTVLNALIRKAEKVTILFDIYADHIDCAYFQKPLSTSGKLFNATAYKYKLHFIACLQNRMFEIIKSSPGERQLVEEGMMSQHPIVLYKAPPQAMMRHSHVKPPILRLLSF
jgi:hypothetical protein